MLTYFVDMWPLISIYLFIYLYLIDILSDKPTKNGSLL